MHPVVGRIPVREDDESRKLAELGVRGFLCVSLSLLIFSQPLGLCCTQFEIYWSLPGMSLI